MSFETFNEGENPTQKESSINLDADERLEQKQKELRDDIETSGAYISVGRRFKNDALIVKDEAGFLHVGIDGKPLYDRRFEYVGDYGEDKDGLAYVFDGGRDFIIDREGRETDIDPSKPM